MKYENLYNDFKNLFPSDINKLDKLASDNLIDDSDGMHVIFGMVVVPFLVELVKNNDTNKIRIAFDFFEKMAKDSNSMISEVLEFTILEDIISRGKKIINICKPYMKKNTLDSCMKVEKYMLN